MKTNLKSLPVNWPTELAVPTVTLEHISQANGNRYCADASDIGLRVGQWPHELPTTIGNKQPLVRTRRVANHNGVIAYEYDQVAGSIILTIFND